jgi:Holliday junction resolvase RusA-like endonuclease
MTEMRAEPRWEGDPYKITAGTDANGLRYVEFSLDRPVLPAVRQTQKGKYVVERARDYNAWSQGTRDQLLLIMRREDIDPFEPGHDLRLSAAIKLAPRVIDVQQDRGSHKRQIHPALTSDLNNLVKALEDAIQGALYVNDRQIRAYGQVTVEEAPEDNVWCGLQELDGAPPETSTAPPA